jgi:hypothetical protein
MKMELNDCQKEYFATRFYFHSQEQKKDNVYSAIKAGGIIHGMIITLEKLGYSTKFLLEEDSE